jgi:hypothetical protein
MSSLLNIFNEFGNSENQESQSAETGIIQNPNRNIENIVHMRVFFKLSINMYKIIKDKK